MEQFALTELNTATEEIRVIHTIASLRPDAGGPSRSVPSLCNALAARGAIVNVVSSTCREELPSLAQQITSVNAIQTRTLLPYRNRGIAASLRMTIDSGGRCDLIHNHGIWLAMNHEAARIARSDDIPLTISPRGMFLPWALKHHSFRKKIALGLYQWRDLKHAEMLFATSEEEAQELRRMGLTQAIAIVPNGVESPVGLPLASAGRRVALFLSRLHKKKGLHDLIRAWARVDPKDWKLVVAGPDEGTYGHEMRALVSDLGASDNISFVGSLTDEEKWPLFRSANLFVLPTYSENFGIAIAEALSAGVPVLTTTGAPWKCLLEEQAGWWVPPGENSIADALAQAVSCTESQLIEMGQRGKAYVDRELTWHRAAEKTLEAYKWMLHGGVRPAHIYV